MLYCKNAELDALRNLDNAIKPQFLPILGIGPGQFNDLTNTIEKDKEATLNLRVALTLDEAKFGKSKKQPARDQFDALFRPTNGFAEYYSLVNDWGAAIPTLRSISGIYENPSEQIANARALDRGLLVHVRRHEYAHFVEILERGSFDDVDCAFAVDAEWSVDVLQAEAWMSSAITRITGTIPEAEIICLSSSFPKGFGHIGSKGVFSNDDRELFDRLQRRHNAARLTYGDWGSTRASEETIANRPRPRVDIPTQREWISFRQEDKDGSGYIGQAKKARLDSVWATLPECWGKRLVELTALERPIRIRGTQSANSARINLHLTTQSMAGTMDVIPEEPFVDNF